MMAAKQYDTPLAMSIADAPLDKPDDDGDDSVHQPDTNDAEDDGA